MISLSFLANWNPIWLMIALVIIIYAGLKKIKLPGNDFVLALLSFLLSFTVVSSLILTNYMSNVISLLAVILAFSFLILLVLVFVAGDINFSKYLARISFIVCMLIIIFTAFHTIPIMFHLLPLTSNAGLSSGLSEFKDYLYSKNIRDSIIFIATVALCSFFLLKKFD